MKEELSLTNIMRLTFPTVVSQATIMLVGVADLYFVGRIGTTAVAALSIATTVWSMIACFFEGLRLGTTVMTSRLFGASDHESMLHVARSGLIISLVAGVALMLFALPITHQVYRFAIEDVAVARLGEEYFPYILYAGGFVFSTFVIDGLFRGVSRVIIPTVVTLFTQGINIVLDYAFTRGFMGIAPMGVRGVALATLIAYVLGMMAAATALYLNGFHQVFRTIRFPELKVFREYMRVAAEVGTHAGLRVLAFFLLTKILGEFGAGAVAAHQIGHQVFLMSYLPALGFMFTMSMLVGRVVGAKRVELLSYLIPRVVGLGIAVVSLVGVLMWVFSFSIAHFFSPTDPIVAANAAMVIKFSAVSQFLVMCNFMTRGILNGTQNTSFLVIASLATTYGFFVPLAYLLAVYFGLGLVGCHTSIVIWNLLDTIVNTVRARKVVQGLLVGEL